MKKRVNKRSIWTSLENLLKWPPLNPNFKTCLLREHRDSMKSESHQKKRIIGDLHRCREALKNVKLWVESMKRKKHTRVEPLLRNILSLWLTFSQKNPLLDIKKPLKSQTLDPNLRKISHQQRKCLIKLRDHMGLGKVCRPINKDGQMRFKHCKTVKARSNKMLKSKRMPTYMFLGRNRKLKRTRLM